MELPLYSIAQIRKYLLLFVIVFPKIKIPCIEKNRICIKTPLPKSPLLKITAAVKMEFLYTRCTPGVQAAFLWGLICFHVKKAVPLIVPTAKYFPFQAIPRLTMMFPLKKWKPIFAPPFPPLLNKMCRLKIYVFLVMGAFAIPSFSRCVKDDN